MECTNNGTIIRAKELNTSFTIPKKRKAPADSEAPPAESNVKLEPESILKDAYGTSKGPSWLHNPQAGGFDSLNANIPIREVPKIHKPENYSSHKEMSYFADMHDSTLPKELKDKFQPLFCKLCSATLGSTVNAKLHYLSKNHDKKVRRFLVEHSERTGEPLHKRAHAGMAKKNDEEYNPKHFHCEECDLPLTGRAHAESHYMGKNHQKVLAGRKAPTGRGFYNDDGKYVRVGATKVDPTGRFGIGADFLPKPTPEEEEASPPKATCLRCDICHISVTSLPQMDTHLQGQKHLKKAKGDCDTPSKEHAESPDNGKNVLAGKKAPAGKGLHNDDGKFKRVGAAKVDLTSRFDVGVDIVPNPKPEDQQSSPPKATCLRCDICHISVTSLPQMDMHLVGQKHLKKLKQCGVISSPVPKTDLNGGGPSNMYTSYRTPSGHYYCKVCDVSLNSESQFSTHLQSKNHAKKSNAVKD